MTGRRSFLDPDLTPLVERQMRNWELARSQRLTSPGQQPRTVEDFVCLSRQPGTDGASVARAVGKRLGWPVFDREILEAMAGDDEVRRRVYESMDERDLGWWEEALRSMMHSEFVRNDYFKRLTETVLSLARQSSCVFLGRGTDLLLDPNRGFRARLVGPEPWRVKNLVAGRVMTEREAIQYLRRIEAERARFLRNHFGIAADAPDRCDITVNVARFGVAEAAEVILQARAARHRVSK